MPYISLYRKYRSQTFDDVVGQDHVVRTIRNAIKAGRIAQGYLFCGSRGTGKTSVARLIAKALNCESGPTPDPCNQCEACTTITAGAAVDVIEMDAASNRSVDDVDALRDGVKYPPMRLRYKVYIIDEAHQLSPQAKDAFLKTLEEPPPHAVFILATTEAHKIPITIRSRCLQFDFRRGTSSEIEERLRHVAAGEKANVDDDAIALIARAANGSYRDSLSLLEQVLAYTEDVVTAKDVYAVLGMVDEEVLLELGDVLASHDAAAAFTLAERLMREGRDAREVLRSAANHFRDLLALKVGAEGRRSVDGRWRSQAEDFSQDRLVHIIDEFSAADKELRWNDQHRLGLELALLKAMARPVAAEAPAAAIKKPAAPAQEAVARPAEPVASSEGPKREQKEERADKPEQPVEAAPVAREEVPEPPPSIVEEPVASELREETGSDSANTSASLAEIRRNWDKILRHLQKVMKLASVAAQAREGEPIDLSDSTLTIGFAKRHSFHQNGVQQQSAKLAQAISDVMGVQLKILTTVAEGMGSGGSGRAAPPPQTAEPEQHPLLGDVLTTFNGDLQDGGDDPWGGNN